MQENHYRIFHLFLISITQITGSDSLLLFF